MRSRSLLFGLALLVPVALPSHAKDQPTQQKAAAPPSMTRGFSPQISGLPADLPRYVEPDAYHVDLVVESEGQRFTMKRSIDHGRIRTEFEGMGEALVMIELGDARGTQYTLMPSEKMAIKQTYEGMAALSKKAGVDLSQKIAENSAAPANAKIEDLGTENLDGIAARKIRFVMDAGSTVGWFDPENGAPLRMESDAEGHTSTMAWKNFKPGPQPAANFEIPKKYQVTDMDEMMAQMEKMKGGPGGAQMSALMGSAGMGGGLSAGLNGIAGQMGQNFGSGMGGSFGATLGGALGGPLGAIAGQYIGGKVGGAIGKKAAEIVTPGK
jgi:hypothetical protein